MLPAPSPLLIVLFIAVTLGTLALLLLGLARFAADRSAFMKWVLPPVFAWAALSAALGSLGLLKDFSMPPKVGLLIVLGFVLTVVTAFSRPVRTYMDRVPLWFVIGINVFRLPLELTMHLAASEGIMPPQMSYSGSNLDILTGCLALPTAWLAYKGKLPHLGMRLFNIVGATLLINIVGIAVMSMPTPLRRFLNDPPNIWIADFPFVWLPTVLVPIALFSHLTLFRRVATWRG